MESRRRPKEGVVSVKSRNGFDATDASSDRSGRPWTDPKPKPSDHSDHKHLFVNKDSVSEKVSVCSANQSALIKSFFQ